MDAIYAIPKAVTQAIFLISHLTPHIISDNMLQYQPITPKNNIISQAPDSRLPSDLDWAQTNGTVTRWAMALSNGFSDHI
jgi:hypothetical protein